MGRRSINTTKSGKYMNPTDQARKEARKKELKKNKKQRQMVRAAVLKGKDPVQLIQDMERIDEMEYDVDHPPLLNEKVLKDKRKKLRDTLERVLRLYEKEDREVWLDLRKKLHEYEKSRDARMKFFESVKNAQQVQVDEIPLPAMDPGEMFIPMPGDIPLPSLPIQPHSILKKASLYSTADKKKKPPGVPPGPPPPLSDDDDGSDDEPYDPELDLEAAEKEHKMSKSRKIRFADSGPGDDGNKEGGTSNLSQFGGMPNRPPDMLPGPGGIIFRGMPPMPGRPPMRLPPGPPPGLPPRMMPPPVRLPPGPPPGPPPRLMRAPMGIPPPGLNMQGMPPPGMPPPGGGMLRGQSSLHSNVVSAPPMMSQNAKKDQDTWGSSATIEAKPQIRSLNADVTRFLPTSLRVKREEKGKKRQDETVPSNMQRIVSVTGATKDDAYEQFMKEMEDLL